MNLRRSTARALALLFGLATIAGTAPPVSSAPLAPNILVIVTDDQRVDTLHVMPRTQRLFIDEGVTFTNAFATTPLCCQSRASIMTGRYAHNHGVKHFTPYELDQTTTVQAHLSESGYRTGIYGKYLNNWNIEDAPPFFDDWAVFPQSNEETYAGGTWNVNGHLETVSDYSTDYLLGRAERFLRAAENDDLSPWYMYISTPAPHSPFVPEERFASTPIATWEGNPAIFEENLDDKPNYVRRFDRRCDLECGTELRSQQLRTLMSVDDLVGDLFVELDGLLETTNTLAIFISDNGFFWGEHGLTGKKQPYLPGVRIPLLLRWPLGAIPAEDDRIAANIDVGPTILETAGATPSEIAALDGRSLLSASERRHVLLEHWRGNGVPTWSSLISPRYQYVENGREYEAQKKFFEYYDLSTDPYQLDNLLRDGRPHAPPHSPRLRRLHRALLRAKSCAGTNCP